MREIGVSQNTLLDALQAANIFILSYGVKDSREFFEDAAQTLAIVRSTHGPQLWVPIKFPHARSMKRRLFFADMTFHPENKTYSTSEWAISLEVPIAGKTLAEVQQKLAQQHNITTIIRRCRRGR